ncbi:hypothetical protein [Flexivirga sp. B27]
MTARRAARAVPVFVDAFPEWTEYRDREADLLDRQRVAQDRERDAQQEHRAALREYDRQLSAAALGEADPPGERPTLDPVPGMVAARARERVRAHRATRVALLADLADRVQSAASEWWTTEAPTVVEHVRQVTADAERLSDALRQVREVRAALDREHVAAHGVRPAASLADRTAGPVAVATLASLGDSDPFALADAVLPRGRVQRDPVASERLGVQRYETPEPSTREPSPPATPDRDPVRDRL